MMRRLSFVSALTFGATLLMTVPVACLAQNAADDLVEKPIPVKLVQKDGQWQLLRDGKPFFIQGAGGGEKLRLLKASGGNSVRTWGADNMENLLDAALYHGLTVTIGIWLGHTEHGFRYDNPTMLAEQFEKTKLYVEKYKNHPALLMWALGNEMEGDGKDPNVWKHIEELAAYVKKADPNHPVMTVTAEIGADGIKAKEVARLCPSIDVLGVNSYGGLATMPQRLKAAGWTKPFVVTEFGPPGPWEVGKTEWNATLEPNSTEKAAFYRKNYQNSILASKGQCLGSYVFLWGDKVEGTPTWFGMFLPVTGEKLGTVDTMQELWSGKVRGQAAPEITEFTTSAGMLIIAPGTKQTASCTVKSPTNPLLYRFEVRADDTSPSRPDPGQAAPALLDGLTPATSEKSRIEFMAPSKPGAYRLYVYVKDGKGGAATANVPFLVK